VKIGITLNMSVAFWANGMQQNIVFLYSLLEACGHDCYYITNEKPKYAIHKNHKGMILSDVLADKAENFDVLIVAGFDLLPEMYQKLLRRNDNLKIILIHYGNKLMDDMHYGISGPDSKKTPVAPSKYITEVWTSPHYDFAKSYLQTYYNLDNVKIAPYIWDSFFVDQKVAELKKKNMDPYFSASRLRQVCVFEPNKTHSKNCLIPVMICERYGQLFSEKLESVNVFCAEKIRTRSYFSTFIKNLDIGSKKDFIYFNNRWSSLDACSKFGSVVISHQMYNELNYSHLESLYLGLPLIHNSEILQDVGYYYPEFNVEMGAKQLKNAIQNHASVIEQYKKDVKIVLEKFSVNNQENIKAYQNLIDG
jgi:hypothetical protein